jgi:membrane protease YdiL (CAAX protease family)
LAGIALWLAGVVLFSALASPGIFHLLEALGRAYPFERVFNRSLMVGALLLLGRLWLFWGRPDPRDAGLAWPGAKPALRVAGLWFLAGAAMLLAVFFWYLGWEARVWKAGASPGRLLGFALSAGAVGLLEEPLFRGFFFLALVRGRERQAWAWAAATSVFFAATHFFKAPEWNGAVGWGSGFALWAQMAASTLAEPGAVLRWSGLFWTGLCLCALAWRHGHVWGAVGLHAGWVFLLKAFHALSDHGERESPLWFAPDLVSGLWTQMLLAAAVVWICRGKRL